nr:hypothetical protein [Tanacetum cinerariifolium]
MALTFADTHNMIAFLTKLGASEGFLNVSSIKYALTVNPNIYVSVIKQFWSSVTVKKVNDVSRLQALVDRKKVIISEATIRGALRLADEDGIECLPNEEIFTELARMGKRVFWSRKPLFEGMIVAQQVGEGATEVNVKDVSTGGVAAEGAASADDDEVPAAVDKPYIPSPTLPTQPPPPLQDIPSTSQGRIIADIDANKDVTLKDVVVVAKDVQDVEIEESSYVQGRQAESQAQIYQIDLEHADKVLSMHDVDIEPSELQEVVEVVTTAKLITKVVTAASTTITTAAPQLTTAAAPILTTAPSAARRRKGVDKAYARELEAELNKNIDWDEVIDHVKRKEKDDNVKTKEQMEKKDSKALKRLNEIQEVPNDEDDVYTEATPLARKVPVVDYEIYTENNKPCYKIIRADGSPQLFLSFLSLLRNFDREDLEVLWELVKESKGQELEIVRVLWSAYYHIYLYTDDLVSREKISTFKVHSGSTDQH